MSLLREISPKVRSIRLSEQEGLVRRAARIRAELQQGEKKPYKELIDVSWGDAHRGGLKPISFVRQVLAACLYPPLLHSERLPVDARQRAQRLLGACDGGSVGSYTATCGIPKIQRTVSDYITRRDGGAPSSPENIFIASGSQRSLTLVLKLLSHGEGSSQTGILSPVPANPSFTAALALEGAAMVPYHLCEEQGWALQVDELRRVLRAARGRCNPMVLYVCNPGYPTGHVLSRKSIEEVISFAAEEKLFLLADEVYQDSVHGEGSEFVSYKRVLSEMGPPHSSTAELASFNSTSTSKHTGCDLSRLRLDRKLWAPEWCTRCGLRSGYVELVNLDPTVMQYAYTLFSMDSCSAVTGQIALDLMADPPRPGDISYAVFAEEVRSIKDNMINNVRRIQEVLEPLPGISCQPVKGGIFAFPRLHLPPGAMEQAKEAGVEPDLLYCTRLLEEAGLCVRPGCEHGQREGTHHIRFCIMTPEETMEEVLRRLKSFHVHFMSQFS